MSERPQPPSEEDLPEELSIVEVPTRESVPARNRSRGTMGILIAALLGSATAIGLFFVAKPWLDATQPLEEHKPGQVSNETTPRSTPEDPIPGRNAVSQNQVTQNDVVNKPAAKNGNQRQADPGRNPPQVTTTQPDPTEEPFPGLNSKLSKVIPVAPGQTTRTIPEDTTQSMPEIVPVVRRPQPAAEAIAQAKQDIDDVFQSQIRSAKSREEKLLLAKTLLKSASAEPEGSATRFVLRERAIDLAIDAPDSALTSEFISGLTAEFEVESYEYRLQAVDRWDRMKLPDIPGAAERQLHRVLAQKAAVLGDLAYERKDFKTAAVMYAIASKRRDRADDKETSDLFGKKRTAARTQEARHTLATNLLAELKANPDDAEKKLEAGIACVQVGLWSEGLTCLAEGSDESLQSFAQQQLKMREDPTSSMQAGDRSWEAAGQLDRRHSIWLKELAIANYESAFTELSPLQVQKVKQRVEQVGPVSCVWPEPLQHFAFESADFIKIKNDDVLLNQMGHFGNGQLYGSKDLELGIRGSALEFDGRKTMIVCPETQDLILGDSPFTISLWIHINRSQDTVLAGRLFQYSSAVEPDFQLRLLNSDRLQAMLAFEKGGAIALPSNDRVPHNQWVHVAMTWDLQSLKLYLEGRENSSRIVAAPHSHLTLGNRAWMAVGGEKPKNDSSPRFSGQIDEVRVYDQALSPLQIFHVYLKDQSTQR